MVGSSWCECKAFLTVAQLFGQAPRYQSSHCPLFLQQFGSIVVFRALCGSWYLLKHSWCSPAQRAAMPPSVCITSSIASRENCCCVCPPCRACRQSGNSPMTVWPQLVPHMACGFAANSSLLEMPWQLVSSAITSHVPSPKRPCDSWAAH